MLPALEPDSVRHFPFVSPSEGSQGTRSLSSSARPLPVCQGGPGRAPPGSPGMWSQPLRSTALSRAAQVLCGQPGLGKKPASVFLL